MKKQSVLRLFSLIVLALSMGQSANASGFLAALRDWFNNYYNSQANGERCYSQVNATGIGAGKVYAEWATGQTYEDTYVDPRLQTEISVQSPNDATANNTLANSTAQHKYVFFAVAEEGWEYEGVYRDADCLNAYTYNDYKLSDDGRRCAARVVVPTSNTSGAPGEVLDIYALFTLNVTINSRGYSTLYYGSHNFKVPSGVTATTYKLGEGSGKLDVSTTYSAGQVIPAGEAVVLQGTPSTTYKFIPVAGTYTPDNDNILRGTDEAMLTTGGDEYFVLSYNNEKGVVGFYWKNPDGSAFLNGAHKAYLPLSGTSGVKGFDFIEDDATGIVSLRGETEEGAAVYNLAGQRVGKMQRGINIINGKKILK